MGCAAALTLSACSGPQGSGRELTVSIPAQKWLLDSIVGDRYEVRAMLGAGSNPETFEPSMQQLMGVQNSAAYFTVGELGFELSAIPKLQENFPSLRIVDSSAGIRRLTGTHAGHSHDDGDHGHDHGASDPHVWTSLPNARLMAKNMYEAVVRLDPDNKEYYTARFRDLDKNLATLNDSVAGALAPLKGRSFVVWHPSLSYFARDYGLEQVSIESPGKEASPAQFREQLDHAGHGTPLLFFNQAEFDSRQGSGVAAELGIPTATIAVMQEDLPAQIRTLTHELTSAPH